MRILWNEVKKILTWKILLLLVLVNSVLYFFLIDFHIENFPNGRPALDSYNIGVEIIDKYGAHMDEEEFLDFKDMYDLQVKEADQYLQSINGFVDAGIDSYEKFNNYDWDNSSDEVYQLRDKVFHEDKVDTFWELQERSRLIGSYEGIKEHPSSDDTHRDLRYAELIAAKQYGVYPDEVLNNFKYFIENVAIAILFSVILVISPMILSDRSQRLLALQYTSKAGRNLYKTKIIAGLISTFIVISALLTVYFRIYSLNKTSMFFEVPINSFINSKNWYNPTFFQYILLCVAAIYLVGFVFGLLAMSFSSIVPNRMALIGIQIPLVIGILNIGMNRLISYIIWLWNPQWLAPIAYSVMIVISVLFIVYLWKREKKRDVVL